MSILHSHETQVLIDRVIGESTTRFGDTSDNFENFLRHYFYSVPFDDLSERHIADLCGCAHAHWELGLSRQRGKPNIRVYNPDAERHSWQSEYTIIEVVTDDRPFLVDSIQMMLNRIGMTIHLTVHPIFIVKRNQDGNVEKLAPSMGNTLEEHSESYLHFEFDRRFESDSFDDLKDQVESLLASIEQTYMDWPAMRQRALEAADEIQQEKVRRQIEDDGDQIEFCRWLEDGNFTFLGYCELKRAANEEFVLDKTSQLGILTNNELVQTALPITGFKSELRTEPLLVTKANIRSPIHRPSYLDLVTIQRYDADGNRIGLMVIIGLFASSAYNHSVQSIPLLRRRKQYVHTNSALPEHSHDAKVLANIIDNYPRDNFFRISEEELFRDVAGIMELQERQRVRVFMTDDPYARFCTVLVYLPRDRYSREMRIRIQNILLDSLQGTATQFDATFTESVLVRINYTIFLSPDSVRSHSEMQILERVEAATRSWGDELNQATLRRFGDKQRIAYLDKYEDAFSVSYQEDFSARSAAADMERMEKLGKDNPIVVFFYRRLREAKDTMHLKVYNLDQPISPSDSLPVIENMGLRIVATRPYVVKPNENEQVWIHDYELSPSSGLEFDPEEHRSRFEEAFLQVWHGEAENDRFNSLVLTANLNWREVMVLRAYSKFLKQIGIQYSESYLIETLTLHPNMTKRIIDLFKMMFDPSLADDAKKFTKQVNFVLSRLEVVISLDEDVILRTFLNVILSTLRTNYYRKGSDGNHLPYLSFKIDSVRITHMPEPRPMYEIFVYSPRVEGIHLRGGKVARGGLRWSDRREDFRTEVLGLVKAQLVKNAVIVPVGSKGGFVVKQMPQTREEVQREVVECYKTFISGLLDLTDNIIGGEVVRPENVKAVDSDDPYLVVAADKGTATFSDIANELAAEYGFWLGDAFASGGSVGYDHKGMAITARGAWESVKRNFRELGTDIQTTDFTVVGIGDMAGDVFGNGMLLSKHIKLVGAFNHMHIFIDPDPNPATSFVERQRMFNLPRSSWQDYNPELISKGGGVFDRSAKAIELSPETQKIFGIKGNRLTPNDLINAMLKAPVDLIWNGGIGTYVKANSETHYDAADRANDDLRVNGSQLKCKVFGEGGNLGMTQLGRVEYSLNGGLCYADFIDNSGGVDCSDHEVNIKILLNEVVAGGDLTIKQRNQLLEQMTDTVAEYVLADNYDQSQAISLANTQGLELVHEHRRFIRELERAGELNRELEFLPDNETIKERAMNGQGLTKPELSVLLAYSKLTLFDRLLDSDFPEGSYLSNELKLYFPNVLVDRYLDVMFEHRLKREIVATYATNSMVNRVGPTFAFRLHQLSGASYPEIACAYTAVREVFGMRAIWSEIEALDNKVDAQTQIQMLLYAGGLIERACMWVLRHCESPIDIQSVINFFQSGVAELSSIFPEVLSKGDLKPMRKQIKVLTANNVPETLAKRVAEFIPMSAALDIVEVSRNSDTPVPYVAQAYFEAGARLNLKWIRDQVALLPAENLWHQLAKSRLRDDVHGHQSGIVLDIVQQFAGKNASASVSDWIDSRESAYKQLNNLVDELRSAGSNDFATLSVAISEVNQLRRYGGISSDSNDKS